MKRSEINAQAILDALTRGPLTTKEITAITGVSGGYLANTIKPLLASGKVSRVEVTKGRWRYYIGQTAPKPVEPPPPRRIIRHAIPVRQVTIPRSSVIYSSAAPVLVTVSLPAEPWL